MTNKKEDTMTAKPQANILDEIREVVHERILQAKDICYGSNGRLASNQSEGDYGDWQDWEDLIVALITEARIDELERTMPHTDGMRHYNTVVKRLAELKENI